ncbi:MAG: hypothetical protein ABGY29_10780 [bacterium]
MPGLVERMLSCVTLPPNPFDFFVGCPMGLPLENSGAGDLELALGRARRMTARRLCSWR